MALKFCKFLYWNRPLYNFSFTFSRLFNFYVFYNIIKILIFIALIIENKRKKNNTSICLNCSNYVSYRCIT